MTKSRTLFDKIWDRHVVLEHAAGISLLHVDRHLVHEGSFHGFAMLDARNLAVAAPEKTFATADHYVTTGGPKQTAEVAGMVDTLGRNAGRHGIQSFLLGDSRQGIVHVIGPELGMTLPGMVVVCGDSHTSTHGGLGAFAFGIGQSELAHVLATQTIWQRRPATMRVTIDGALPGWVSPKDIILALIGKIGTGGATGFVIEYAGAAIRAMSVEGRLTICNMSIEAGAKAGLVAPDDTTFAYLEGRPFAPAGPNWDKALRHWRTLHSDDDAGFGKEIALDASVVAPMVSWGTSPEDVSPIDGLVPDPAAQSDPGKREKVRAALDYMDLRPGVRLDDIPVDLVFIGSCTNGRIEDLRAAADLLKDARVAVPTIVVPGSMQVRRQAEAEGLASIFVQAGAEWRDAGCSMCVGMNGDVLGEGKRSASTTNRNFPGRQGKGARTHILSPAMAAAAAVTGRLTDIRKMGNPR